MTYFFLPYIKFPLHLRCSGFVFKMAIRSHLLSKTAKCGEDYEDSKGLINAQLKKCGSLIV